MKEYTLGMFLAEMTRYDYENNYEAQYTLWMSYYGGAE